MKQTKPSILELRIIPGVFGGQLGELIGEAD
jgi:hypothetical protein